MIQNHDYLKSRFLRGARQPDEADLIPLTHIEEVQQSDIKQLSYINESGNGNHVLNKLISFDDTQQAILQVHPPLIIIGSAGSGKTVFVPDEILPPYRKQSSYVNSVLASHEMDKNNPYNKMLFKRVKRGRYVVNASLIYN